MFKIESYITPVILSYVEKYVKNFKPEQSQVSLWGGDASFQNLDLRLEVLEEQLNLPFTFVSGHIHELLIHVPWVKITSEPIVVTINTIECILNLKDQGQADRSSSTHQGPGLKAIQGESPPGYIKSIVTKVINNITINCNNLILKYVEEDIVLSVNVRFLSMQTVNELWEPALTDVSSSEVALRKIIIVEDLTLCLDKMDTAGKIEIYQDPVLYRCSMLIRLMMNYHNNVAKCASLTRFDLHCEKMEFSITEQQLPMLLRLIALITSLQTRRSSVRSGDKTSHSMDERGDVSQEDEDREHGSATEGPDWSGWAWNTVTSFLPVNWDPDWVDEQPILSTGHVIHMGVYIDAAVLTFKTVETVQEQLFYKSRKIRYNSFLTLRVTGAVMSMLMRGVYMHNLRFGLGSIRMQPQGVCSCGHQEVLDGVQPPIYLSAGAAVLQEYLKDSLFDKNRSETTNWKNYYSDYDINHHLAIVSVKSMLERSAAFGMDIIHSIEISDDFPEEKLLEFESNFEYSNFPERKVTRYVMGDLKIQLCTGLMHRLETIKAAAKYDHSLYASRKPEPSYDELPPVTVEEYEALRENVSVTETYFEFYRLALQFQLTDHNVARSSNPKISMESKFDIAEPSKSPHLSVECSKISGSFVEPMYGFRLASCASRQTELDPDMLNDCYNILTGKICGFHSQLYLNANCRTTIVVPCNAKFIRKSLVYPQYFRQSNVNHDLVECEIEDVTVTGTKAKLMLAASIASSIAYPTDNSNPLFCTSLFMDACNEKDSVFLELSLEYLSGKRKKSSSEVSIKIDVNSIKAFALNGTQQAFILSGPENDTNLQRENRALLSAILQYSESIMDESHPSILSFSISETRSSFDPLLSEWLRYQPTFEKTKEPRISRPDAELPPAGDTSSDTDVRKKIFRTLHESVHSLSDKDKKRSNSRTDWSKGISGIADESAKKLPGNEDNQIEELQKPGMAVRIAQLYPFWRKLVMCGSIGHFVMYLPTATMDGVGVAGIEPAKDRALDGNPSLHIFAIKSPTVLVHSVNQHYEKLSPHLKTLPAHLPLGIWSQEYRGFPWTFNLKGLSCYSLKKSSLTSLVRSVDLNVTIDVTTKSAVTEIIEGTPVGLGLCVYIDTSPIIISLSEEQIAALTIIASEVKKVTDIFYLPDEKIEECLMTEADATYFDVPKTPSSYNPVVYPENTTSPSSISTARDSTDQTESDSPVITAMIQWTIAKMSLKLYTIDRDTDKTAKLLLELEDIITTFDWQPIYVKFKNKITTARICHFTRESKHENWELGDYAGLIMLGRESSSESEDTGFLSITYTKAQSGNVHTRWGAQKHQKFQKIRAKRDCPLSVEGYITEIDANLQRVDVILPPSVVHKFVSLLKPLCRTTEDNKNSNEEDTAVPLLRCDNFENKSLPLVYLEFKGMNLVVPISSSFGQVLQHDLLIVQLDGISITPSTENPICRTVLRSDVYQLAAQSNILNIPGSSVEDRQYQVNIRGICACTTTWQNYQQNVHKRSSQSYLYTMNENPALVWNNLSRDSDLEPQFSTSLLMSRIDVRLIIAPAVVLHPSKIICGGAFELTCLTDIDIAVNVDQMKLVWQIYTEINNLLCDCSSTPENVDHLEKSSSLIARKSSHVIRAAPVVKDQEPDFAADSGIDFESTSVNYGTTVCFRKTPKTRILAPLPLEVLVNCGSVTIALHMIPITSLEGKKGKDELDAKDTNYEFPCFHLMMIEPNVYISQLNEKEKMQISCFDVALSLRGASGSEANEKERTLALIETKNGSPHPNTGIPASFVVLKCEGKRNASAKELFVDVGRPTRINCSMVAVRHIDRIHEEITACFVLPDSQMSINESQALKIDTAEGKLAKFGFPELGFKTRQLVIHLDMANGTNVAISVARSSGDITRSLKSDRINGNLRLDSLVVSSQCFNDIRVFLNPSFFRVEASIFWETWQDPEDEPQIKIQAHSDGVYFEVGPQQMQTLDRVIQEYYAFAEYIKPRSTTRYENDPGNTSSAAQHYKDDLKAGAFQFVEGDAHEIPSPYQVVFYTYPEKGMAWRYPQPRIITGLHVSPIPFEISDNADSPEEPVRCCLEYWSESHGVYRRHAEFELSETDSSQPEPLPCTTGVNNQVASVWRVTIMSPRSSGGKERSSGGGLAPQVLVGCLRVDSYFDPSAVPNLQISVNIASCRVSICGEVDVNFYDKFPEPVAKYRLNAAIPETQRFAELEHRETSIVLNGWQNGGLLIDGRGVLNLSVLDYGTLEMREVIERLESVVQVSASDETNVTIECNPVTIKYGPSIAHTIAVATNLWLNNERSSPILTRVCVANDTNVNLLFGQAGTTDCVQLRTRECHFYCWRSPDNCNLRVAIETATGWIWSQAFAVNSVKRVPVVFANSTEHPAIFARVEAISATQKLVTITAALLITNRLVENFQMRLVEMREDSRGKSTVRDEIFWIGGNDQPASIALENTRNMAMRLRFATTGSLAWTGDIPLKSNSKIGQPWLVKVPLQDRGQFLSIWVRVVEETIHGETRILVVMSPLYMIRSYLPVPVVIKIETPSLGMSSNATIQGQGKRQQLYCPGTFEHCHQLTFQFESSTSASNPYVPLSYNSIEERSFFARPRNEDIDEILAEFDKTEKTSYLPFQSNYPNVQISADQPQTHVQIKYRDAGFASSTLLLELQPWCFVYNTLGCNMAILVEDAELCQLPHNGIVTPPKLEGTFHLRVTVENTDYVSPALQLARPDWNPGFYMPRIRGLVPVDGNIQTSIECEPNIFVITVNSKMHEDMRILRFMASHVLCNLTPHEFHVACLAVADAKTGVPFPDDNSLHRLVIPPCDDRSQGIPVVQWRMIHPKSTPEQEALYVSLKLGSSWSCPIRVDKKVTTRRCTAISDDDKSVPVVITTQEDEGTTYVFIHIDDHPQFYIENSCPFPILLGEANPDNDGIYEEASHFAWRLEVEPDKSCYYTTPRTASRMPDSQTTEPLPKLRLCVLPSSQTRDQTLDEGSSMWSRSINMSNVTNSRTEQYVRLPVYGDIKLLTAKRCHTICLRVVCMSQVEISAHDIRTRLILEENKSAEMEFIKSPWLDSTGRTETAFDFGAKSDSGTDQCIAQNEEGQIDEGCLRLEPPCGSGDGKALKGSLTLYFRGVNVTIMQDVNESAQRVELASLCLTDLIVVICSSERSLTLCACVGDMQLDNQMFEQGGFDFPVVFMSQNPYTRRGAAARFGSKSRITHQIEDQSLLSVDCAWKVNGSIYACSNVNIKIGPISAYIEDTFVTQLLEYTTSSSPPSYTVHLDDPGLGRRVENIKKDAVIVPEHVIHEATNLRTPLRLEKFTIEPISVLLSVHTSIRLYVALDHSPLYFGAFEREHLATTPGGLANALIMHYLSGALFGAGWVVGSLEILGSPGGFAQALGSGLKDFVTLPIQGILRGPWSFLIGITQGSASLMKHLTAGTVNSVTKLASSVARNLDRLTLDDEHLQRQEESRRTRPQGMAQGLYQGLTGFGMSLLAAVAGLAHHPLQQVLSGAATPRGLVTGVGLGIVGAVTKPLSGAAELVALTGQGLLEGTGWNPLPTPRQRPVIESVDGTNNASFKCVWRLLPLLTKKVGRILHIIDAECPVCESVTRRVVLILTRHTLVVANLDDGNVDKIYLLRELTSVEHVSDSRLLCLYCLQNQNSTERTGSPVEYSEMDQAMRVRVEQFVRGSSTGCASFSSAYQQSETIEDVLQSNPNNKILTFHVEAHARNYFLSLFEAAKRQNQGSDFIVL